MKQKDRIEERDRFESWLMYMEDALAEFMTSLDPEVRDDLDFSIESLDVLEAMLLARYPTVEVARASGDSAFFDGCARYIGETLIRELGGTWDIDLKDPSSIHYRLPTVAGFSNTMMPVAPLQWAFTAIRRRKGDFMTRIVGNFP